MPGKQLAFYASCFSMVQDRLRNLKTSRRQETGDSQQSKSCINRIPDRTLTCHRHGKGSLIGNFIGAVEEIPLVINLYALRPVYISYLRKFCFCEGQGQRYRVPALPVRITFRSGPEPSTGKSKARLSNQVFDGRFFSFSFYPYPFSFSIIETHCSLPVLFHRTLTPSFPIFSAFSGFVLPQDIQ